MARGRYSLPVVDVAVCQAHALAGTVSHRSAALHWGWEVKTVPDLPDITIRRKRHLKAGQCEEVDLHWADLDAGEVDGHFTSRERTLVDCLRSLPVDEALAIADSALRSRSFTKARVVELVAEVRGPGAPQARRVARESVLRAIALDVPGLDLRPQQVISDRSGAGRADLVDRARRWVVEAESHTWHSRRGALRRDCRRYTKLVLLGWRVLRFVWEDVMFHPDYVRECLVEAACLADEQAGSGRDGDSAA